MTFQNSDTARHCKTVVYLWFTRQTLDGVTNSMLEDSSRSLYQYTLLLMALQSYCIQMLFSKKTNVIFLTCQKHNDSETSQGLH